MQSHELPWTKRFFSESYTFATPSQFSYNSNITLAGGVASLTPLTTSYQTDFNVTQFNAGTNMGTAWDSSTSYLRLSPLANTVTGYYTSFEGHDFVSPATDEVDPSLGTQNVTGYGCGNTTAYGHVVQQGNALMGAGSFMYSGSAQQGNTYAFLHLVNLQNANLVISPNTLLSYWIYPSGLDASNGVLVNGNNSTFAALDLVFKDGTDTRASASIVDANGIALNPNSQGTGGYLKLNQWNRVQVAMGALSGKTLDHIDVGWQRLNATLGYLGFIDELVITNAQTPAFYTNTATLDASWTPQYANLKGYWPMDGNGLVANGSSIAATVGTALSASNINQGGMAYVNGRLSQGLYLDGLDDFLSIPVSNFPNSTSMSFAAWVLPTFNNDGLCRVLLSLGSSSADLDFSPYCHTSGVALATPSDYITAGGILSGVWAHLAFTYDSGASVVSIYINGQLSTAQGVSSPLSSSLGNTPLIGKDNNLGNPYSLYSGVIDEVAVWGSVLSASDVAAIYSRQAPAVSGTFTSRVMNSPFHNAGATSINWNTTLPFFKALPANAASESLSSYPSLYSGSLNAGLVSHWKFDETALGSVPGGGDFADDSGQNNTLVRYACLGVGLQGIFNDAFRSYAGCRGAVAGQVLFNNPTSFTTQVWVHVLPGSSGILIAFGNNPSGDSGTRDRITEVESDGTLRFCTYGGCLASQKSLYDNRWHHVVSVVASPLTALYIDGQLVASDNSGWTPGNFSGYWHVGSEYCWVCRNYAVDGVFDEGAVWNRGLSAAEVLQLYRRGINRQKFQLRTCTSATCADNPTWQGPDGTVASYFTELENAVGTAVSPNAPNLNFGYVAPSLVVSSTNAYMQYRVVQESDDTMNLCVYDGNSAPCSPETTAVNFTGNTYNSGSPNVTITTAAALPFSSLSSMVESLAPAGCPQGVTYALSSNGATWYYYTSSWTTTNGTAANTQTAAALNAQMSTFQATAGSGKIYFSAFLNSNGLTPCALQTVTFGP